MRHILITSSNAAMGAVHVDPDKDFSVLDFYGSKIYWREEGGGHIYKAINKQFVRLRKCRWREPICICTFEDIHSDSSKLNANGLTVHYRKLELTEELNDLRHVLLHTQLEL